MWRKYFFIVAGCASFLTFITIFFNICIDPYDIWMLPRKEGINLYAVRSEDNERLLKPIHLIAYKPDVIFMGNSKCDFAIDPDYFGQITGIEKVYNASLRSGQPYEMRKYLEFTLSNNPELKAVYLAIDYEMFQFQEKKMPGFDENQINRSSITLDNVFKTTLSWDALKDSLMTLKYNQENQYAFRAYEKTGKMSESSLKLIFEEEDSFYKNTRGFIINQYMRNKASDDTMCEDKFQELKKIVEICKSNQIELTVFVLPVHAIHMDVYDKNWKRYEEWERRLVDIVPIVDFLSYNEMTMTSSDVSINENKYFWDSAHIKSQVGNIILNRLANKSDAKEEEDFGILVSKENVEEHLCKIRQQHEQWKSKNPQIVKRLSLLGRFSSEYPHDFEKRILNDSNATIHVDGFKCDTKLHRNQILIVKGDLSENPSRIQSIYIVLEGKTGEHYYTMANKPWRNSLVDLFSPNKKQICKFMTEAIMEKLPLGKYKMHLIYTLNDGQYVFKSSELADIALIE